MNKNVQHIFLVGAKSLGAYGGYETFINKLTEYHESDPSLQYYVACKANGDGSRKPEGLEGAVILSKNEFEYHGAKCFQIDIPEWLGPAQAIYYDVKALKECCRFIEREKIENPIIYIMACRIGPFIKKYYKRIHHLGGRIYLNPDGHEWMRAKWSAPIRKYWKWSEKKMVRFADLVVCDSKNIEAYIHTCYDGKGLKGTNPKTTFIAYGAECRKDDNLQDNASLLEWYQKHDLKKGEYYLVVGRFVPENNYETMIREFMNCSSKKSFAIITNVNDKFLMELEKKLHYKSDPRIKFVGTVYEAELLMNIRENAYGYFHGHEVGGTNPSLLEALGSTRLNLLLEVGFNREVAEDSALYWNKDEGNLAGLIERCDEMSSNEIMAFGKKARKRIEENYSWEHICNLYKKIFTRIEKEKEIKE